jgi:putative alpha-1,2-mannosidase
MAGMMSDKSKSDSKEWADGSRILLGEELPAASFKGYFVARFSEAFDEIGISKRGNKEAGQTEGDGEVLAGYVTFPSATGVIDVRVGVSFISIEQARR